MNQAPGPHLPPLPPLLVVHDAADLRTAMDAAMSARLPRLGVLSAPSAGCFLGAPWWRALVALAAPSPVPPGGETLALIDILDCGDAAGRALEALRLGQRVLVLERACPQFPAVRERAASLGATILGERPPGLDLSERGASRRIAAWLATATAVEDRRIS